MTPRNERIFSKNYAKELLAIAEGDLESAKGLRRINAGRQENICYHAQQSIEKAIKAVICWLEKPVPLSHDINLVKASLDESQHPPIPHDLSELTQYATIRRYEEGPFRLDDEDMDSILKLADTTLGWARNLISSEEGQSQ